MTKRSHRGHNHENHKSELESQMESEAAHDEPAAVAVTPVDAPIAPAAEGTAAGTDLPAPAMLPNQTVIYPQITQGIARRMDDDDDAGVRVGPQTEMGGGNLNGSAALILHGQSGTGMGQHNVPKMFSGNTTCGIT